MSASLETEVEATKVHKKAPPKEAFTSALYAIFKELYPNERTVSSEAMVMFNSMVGDLIERIILSATNIARRKKKCTISVVELIAACRFELPPRIATGAIKYGKGAVSVYNQSQ
jgi:histone H3/H4